jgi:hypothetical protein
VCSKQNRREGRPAPSSIGRPGSPVFPSERSSSRYKERIDHGLSRRDGRLTVEECFDFKSMCATSHIIHIRLGSWRAGFPLRDMGRHSSSLLFAFSEHREGWRKAERELLDGTWGNKVSGTKETLGESSIEGTLTPRNGVGMAEWLLSKSSLTYILDAARGMRPFRLPTKIVRYSHQYLPCLMQQPDDPFNMGIIQKSSVSVSNLAHTHATHVREDRLSLKCKGNWSQLQLSYPFQEQDLPL